jgi:ABC-type enterobactin transport system permease subunit
MPLGAILGGLTGAVTFGLLAWRDGEIAIEPPPKPPRNP